MTTDIMRLLDAAAQHRHYRGGPDSLHVKGHRRLAVPYDECLDPECVEVRAAIKREAATRARSGLDAGLRAYDGFHPNVHPIIHRYAQELRAALTQEPRR